MLFSMYPYGLIGNGQISALISKQGKISWLCLPRPDSPPVFGEMLDPDGGSFSVTLQDLNESECAQVYLENTNILITELEDQSGGRIRITDFAPRFEQYGRMYRPASLFRQVEPVRGHPIIQVRCQPVEGWEKTAARAIRGNSHIRYPIRGEDLRLTTNMPLTYLTEGAGSALKERWVFALTHGAGLEDDLLQVFDRFYTQTEQYWKTWVKHCSIPALFQKETIRSALTLKLHCYEDTGAILAALTTSLPEEIGAERNWDYRYCWLRDAHFVLSALHNLGHFEEMEGFLKFIIEVTGNLDDENHPRLAPVYSLSRELPLPETIEGNWIGYQGSRPVRTRNQAAEHVQNDVYGELILTLAPIYFDERFVHLRTRDHERFLSRLASHCQASISQPDAGLWEIRNGWQEHSFTNLMCWAGLERVSRIHGVKRMDSLKVVPNQSLELAKRALLRAVQGGSLRNGPTDPSLDASLSLASVLRFPDSELNLETVRAIQKELRLGSTAPLSSFFYRYKRKDDFGNPGSAFLICSFWIAQALARLGERDEARQILSDSVSASNHLGLFAEHYDPMKKIQLGNFPQTYSHVGMINAAFAVSPPWSEIL